jgi:hypothetical protein
MMGRKLKFRTLLAALLPLTILGCQTVGTNTDTPARIVNPDAASRAALQNAVDTAFGTSVTLADDALTDSSLLTIERSPQSTIDNPNPQGRIMEMPFQLRLYINGNDCILVDERDQRRFTLPDTSCVAE